MLLDVKQIRKAFPIFERKVHGKRLVFLDSAASSQKPQVVIEAIANIYRHSYANVHRGIYTLAEEATVAYEGARERLAHFINAPEVAEVILVRNATEALNLVAYAWGEANVGAGDRVVVTEMEHHANFVPWQQLAPRQGAELVVVPVTDGGELDLAALAEVLDQGDVKIVAVTMMSNVLGTLPPMRQVIDMAHEAGALTVVDAAQAAPHLPLDVQALGADFAAFSGHKMCGPGVGVLWGRREVLEAMPPFLYGGDMIRRVEKGRSLWNELPYKFEAGTPPIAEVVGLGAAVDFLTEIGLEKIHAHEQALVAYATSACSCAWIFSSPISVRKSTAAPKPTTSAMGGVPASNLYGSSFHKERPFSTRRIISPPYRKGGIASSTSRRPQSTPTPGPHILWPEKAAKSAPSACTSNGRCGAACAASTTVNAPASCAISITCRIGGSVPRTFDIIVTATIFTSP